MVLRTIDAYCARCKDPTRHEVAQNDPGSALCLTCGTVQPLVSPVEG